MHHAGCARSDRRRVGRFCCRSDSADHPDAGRLIGSVPLSYQVNGHYCTSSPLQSAIITTTSDGGYLLLQSLNIGQQVTQTAFQYVTSCSRWVQRWSSADSASPPSRASRAWAAVQAAFWPHVHRAKCHTRTARRPTMQATLSLLPTATNVCPALPARIGRAIQPLSLPTMIGTVFSVLCSPCAWSSATGVLNSSC
jgi:hypothetical protein